MKLATYLALTVLGLSILSCTAQYDDELDSYSYDGKGYGYGDGYGDEYSYGYGYGGAYDNDDGGYGAADTQAASTGDSYNYNEYGYYGDEDQSYYEYYGYYADDQYGYQDYYSEDFEVEEQCFLTADGKPVLANGTAPCNIKISGVDKQAKNLPGKLDGIYKLTSCYNGKAMYKRDKSPAGEDRVLWYSSTFGDWDVSRGTEPNEAEILMYGGEMEHASVPLFVSNWHLGADLKGASDSDDEEDEYMPIKVAVACSDGKVYKQDTATSFNDQSGPYITDEEMEAKYRVIYNKYGHGDNSPTVSFTFVVLMVMTGLTIVLAIPYFLLKKKGAKTSMAMSFAQMLQSSRKKTRGHVN